MITKKNLTSCHRLRAATFILGLWLTGSAAADSTDKPSGTDSDKQKPTTEIITSHAIAMHGDIKYPADFKHFDYVSPQALKGGTVRLRGIGTFDSLNPFITRGTSASKLGLVFQTLTTASADEPFTEYGLVAERFEYPADRSWIIYHLNSKARFHDGKAITADDVVFSFNTLLEKGAPLYGYYYADVASVEALDKQRVRFNFKNKENRELVMIVGQLPVLPAHYWKDREFDNANLDQPLGSGPYRIASVDAGRSIVYERVEDYWAKDLPVNVGMYNFDRIQVDYYRDDTVAVEALKAGQLDFRTENTARIWHNSYDTPATARGDLVKQEIRDSSLSGMQAFVMNQRRPPFDNIHFRQAMNYAFDFEWANRNLFHDGYTRQNSFFFNSELAANGLPSGRELEILKQFKDQLPPSVFTEVYTNPTTDGSGNNRANLKKAQALLRQAGYQVQDGKLVHKDSKQPITLEFLLHSPAFERIVNPYIQNLKRLGIEANIRMVDVSQYINRVQSFDFDITTVTMGQSLSPGNEQRDYWTSGAAKKEGSRNYGGISNPVVDQLVDLLINAPDRAELVARTRALDRVLLHHHYVIPQWAVLQHRLVYWNKFGQPKVAPAFDSTFYTGFLTWWIDPEKAAKLGGRQASAKP